MNRNNLSSLRRMPRECESSDGGTVLPAPLYFYSHTPRGAQPHLKLPSSEIFLLANSALVAGVDTIHFLIFRAALYLYKFPYTFCDSIQLQCLVIIGNLQ